MERMRETTVAIIGAGIGGATLALALARSGVDVLVLEQAPAFKPLYKGEYLQPRSLQIFDELGLTEAVRAVTFPVYFNRMARETGEIMLEMDMREFGPFEGRNGHHREIQGAVLGALRDLPNVRLEMGVRLTGLRRQEGPGQPESSGHRDGGWLLETTEGPVAARVVVGADGRRSAVRSLLGIEAVERPYPGAALAVTVNLAGEAEPCVHQLFGSTDSAYYFPLPHRQARLYLVVDETGAARLQAEPDQGLGLLQERLGAYFPHLREAIGRIDSMRSVQSIPSFYLLARRWVTDGAALLGDAAHCVNPARGQGMNMAIADAWELADVLKRTLAAGDLSAAALAPYEQRRRPSVEYIQRDADRARGLFLSQNPVVAWARSRIFGNANRARRASRRLMGVMTGLQKPPTVMEDLLLNAAFMAPALDPLVSDPGGC